LFAIALSGFTDQNWSSLTVSKISLAEASTDCSENSTEDKAYCVLKNAVIVSAEILSLSKTLV